MVGVDVGVGATLVAAAIARAGRLAGRDVVYVKPVQPGAADGADDAADVAALAGVPTVTGPSVGSAGAPGRTLRRAGLTLDAAELREVIDAARRDHPGAELIVDGSGGARAELGSDGTDLSDLAIHADLDVVVVTPARVGGIELAALTIEALERRGVTVRGTVTTRPPGATEERVDAAEVLAATGHPLLATLPPLDLRGDDPLAEIAATFDLGGDAGP